MPRAPPVLRPHFENQCSTDESVQTPRGPLGGIQTRSRAFLFFHRRHRALDSAVLKPTVSWQWFPLTDLSPRKDYTICAVKKK